MDMSAGEARRQRDRIELEAEQLFRARQDLMQNRLLKEEGPSIRAEYKEIREREEELRYGLLLLENRAAPYHPHRVSPAANRPLQHWSFLLMIVTGVLVLLLSWWDGKGSKTIEPDTGNPESVVSTPTESAPPAPSELQ